MSDETRDTLLHSQLQGLRYELMKAPAVSGSHSYHELCLAARNEEKRVAELAKRRQYQKTKWEHPDRPAPVFHEYGRVNNDRYIPNRYPQEPVPVPTQDQPARSSGPVTSQDRWNQGQGSGARRCYKCNQTGHFARECVSRTQGGSRMGPQTAGQGMNRQVLAEDKSYSEDRDVCYLVACEFRISTGLPSVTGLRG